LQGGQGDGGPSFSFFGTDIVNLRKTKKTNHLQVQKSCLKAPHPHAHESVIITPQCTQGPSVILPLGVLGESQGKTEGEASKIGVVEPSLSFFSLSWGQGVRDGSLCGFCKSHKLRRCYEVNIITKKNTLLFIAISVS
jgi:hypothetical protein